jgi:hypothetical protein
VSRALAIDLSFRLQCLQHVKLPCTHLPYMTENRTVLIVKIDCDVRSWRNFSRNFLVVAFRKDFRSVGTFSERERKIMWEVFMSTKLHDCN